MKKLIKTTGLYSTMDCVGLDVDHSNGNYVITATAVEKTESSFAFEIGSEYFGAFKPMETIVCEAKRKNAKKEQQAIEYLEINAIEIAKKYCELCSSRSGKTIEVVEG